MVRKRKLAGRRKGRRPRRPVQGPVTQSGRRPVRRRVRGHGDYEVDPDVANIVAGIGSGVGSLLGNAETGKQAALSLHRIFKKVTGVGDYKVKANSLVSGVVPTFLKDGRAVVIAHSETLAPIYGSINFRRNGYSISPGNSITFPWLSTIAKNFQQYRFKGLLFAFESLALDAVATTNLSSGSVIQATQYDVYAPVFRNGNEMLNSMYATEVKPQEDSLHPIECDRSESLTQLLNVWPGNKPPDDTDFRLYTVGNYSIATQGFQVDGNLIGRLHVTYEIELYKSGTDMTKTAVDHYILDNTMLSGTPFGTALTDPAAFIGLSTLGTNFVTIDPGFQGSVYIAYNANGTGGSTSPPTLTPGGNATAAKGLADDTSVGWGSQSGDVVVAAYGYFDCTGGGTITWGSSSLPTGLVGGDLWITYIYGSQI